MRTLWIIGMCMGAVLGCSENGSDANAGSSTEASSTAGGGSGGSTASASSSGSGAAGGSGGSGAAGGSGGAPSCTLTDSGAIAASMDGQVIENLRIVSSSGPAITVDGYANVVIRNVQILHEGGPGIALTNADDIVIEDVSIEHAGAPASGANPSDELNNIECYGSSHPTISRVRLSRGSSGVYLVDCPSSVLSFLEGHDFRGPFPRGQLVQWDKSSDGVLEDFSVINPAGSWPEDNVNVYESTNLEIRRGFIDGNNSPSGVGVIFDGGFSTGLVEDVDAVHMGNGCFSDYAGGAGVIFRRTRCRDNICTDQGRGVPLSNALMWCGHSMHTDLRIEASTYWNACNPDNIVWPDESFELIEAEEASFTPRAPLDLAFCWE
jgi:hypothetical protein